MSETISAVLDRIEAQQAVAVIDVPTDALGFLQLIYRNINVPLSIRMRAAALALPFESPKLAVTAYIDDCNFADRLEQALVRSAKAMKVIEQQPG
jgi:hypothetical protein